MTDMMQVPKALLEELAEALRKDEISLFAAIERKTGTAMAQPMVGLWNSANALVEAAVPAPTQMDKACENLYHYNAGMKAALEMLEVSLEPNNDQSKGKEK